MIRDIEKYVKDYKNQPFRSQHESIRKEFLIEHLKNKNYDSMLEIGCGFDSIANSLSAKKAITVLEPSKFLCEKLASENKNVHIINGFFEDEYISLSKRKYDIILVSSLLHEIVNPDDFMKKLYESSKGSLVHINVPNAKSFHRLLALESGLIKNINDISNSNKLLQQNSIYDLNMLKKLAESHGFSIIKEGSFFIKPFTHEQMDYIFKSKKFDDRIIQGLKKMTNYFPEYGSEIFIDILR